MAGDRCGDVGLDARRDVLDLGGRRTAGGRRIVGVDGAHEAMQFFLGEDRFGRDVGGPIGA